MYGDDARGDRPRLLQAALNGEREHPATPHTSEEIAAEARAAVSASPRRREPRTDQDPTARGSTLRRCVRGRLLPRGIPE